MKTLKELKALIKEYGGPPISRKAYLKQKPMSKELDEGRMKELHGYIERGMSAQQIARKMKLDVKTIKALMPKKESVDEVRQPLTVPKSLAKYVVYKKTGIGKIKQVAHLRAMPKGKELDRVLDKYDADGVIAMSKIKRNKMQVEAVSPAQQAAIAISKKEKMKEDDFEPHMMYDPKTGKGYKAEKPEDHERMKKMGYTHDKPEIKEGKDDLFQVNVKGEGGATVRAKSEKDAINKAFRKLGIATRFTRDRRYMTKVQVVPAESVEESRAYRDAMKGMKSRSATRGMATTKKDKDIEASDDDRKAASKNIIMQLRKAADLPTGTNVEFEKGKGKVDRRSAQDVLAKFNRLQKPMDKEKFQKSIKSLADIKKILGR